MSSVSKESVDSEVKEAKSLLTIKGLRVSYGRQVILDGLDLRCGTGVFGIYGANGSGKSTLLRTIAGIQRPQGGQVFVDGHDLETAPVESRRQLGYLAEHFSLYPYLSCQELFETVAALREASDEVADFPERLAMLGMKGAANKRISTLSAGQQRKLTLLVALCGNPKVLLLDEPTKALDAQARAFLAETIEAWGKDRLVLIASHLVEVLEAHCSHYCFLSHGRRIAEGSLGDLQTRAGLPGAHLGEVYNALLPDA